MTENLDNDWFWMLLRIVLGWGTQKLGYPKKAVTEILYFTATLQWQKVGI